MTIYTFCILIFTISIFSSINRACAVYAYCDRLELPIENRYRGLRQPIKQGCMRCERVLTVVYMIVFVCMIIRKNDVK
jgi:hypothetical protein